MAGALDRDFLLLVTATPLLNSCTDMPGYLELIWHREWPFEYHVTDKIRPEHFYDEKLMDQLRQGFPHEDITLDRLVNGCDVVGLKVSELNQKQLESRRRWEHAMREAKEPLHILHPGLFTRMAVMQNWTSKLSLVAILPIMMMASFRGSMLTLLTLSSGKLVTPGDGIPAMSAQMVHVLQEMCLVAYKPEQAVVRDAQAHISADKLASHVLLFEVAIGQHIIF